MVNTCICGFKENVKYSVYQTLCSVNEFAEMNPPPPHLIWIVSVTELCVENNWSLKQTCIINKSSFFVFFLLVGLEFDSFTLEIDETSAMMWPSLQTRSREISNNFVLYFFPCFDLCLMLLWLILVLWICLPSLNAFMYQIWGLARGDWFFTPILMVESSPQSISFIHRGQQMSHQTATAQIIISFLIFSFLFTKSKKIFSGSWLSLLLPSWWRTIKFWTTGLSQMMEMEILSDSTYGPKPVMWKKCLPPCQCVVI